MHADCCSTGKGKYVRLLAQAGIGIGLALSTAGSFGQPAPQSDHIRQTALALEQQGKLAEAEIAWRAYSKARPSNPESYGHLGLLEAREGHYKEAVPLYRKALAMNPNVPGLRLNLGLALFKGSELKESIPEFTALLKSAPPNSPEAQRLTILIGMAHYGLAEYAAAAPFLKRAADRDPQSLPLRLALAHSYLWSKQFKYVLDVYHEILALDPDSAEANMIAGEALDEMKDNAGATQMFRNAVKANPKEPNAHFGLGYLLWAQKNYPEAVTEFRAELKNDPDHIQATLYLADADIQLNQLEEAKRLLEKVEKMDPSIPLSHLDLGIVYTDAENNQDALRELTAAAKLAPNDVNVHWRLGRLYRSMGKKEDAKAEFDKASTLNKAADEDLYKKIESRKAKRPESQVPPASPADQ
jgi:tetratricopeptide (TPR) repeat protein